MNLSKNILAEIKGSEIPAYDYFDLPEKVLQFGTGVLLRGLPDYFIDKANKQNIFNGRIVVVKSTDGSSENFLQQNYLYTQCIRGIENGNTVEENSINASISRIISAKNNWNEVLQCAANAELQLIISNTTEVGVALTDDDIHANPPVSFPGKLLAFLYKRFTIFNGNISKGFIIIPTELIINNADKLLAILIELSKQNNLSEAFLNWLTNANHFCNSLVDRIVPGKPPKEQLNDIENAIGYKDELIIVSEPYSLWAIETKNKLAKEILSFSKVDKGIIIADDINIYRELKLRLLNGAHTFSCGLALLAGFATVKEAMDDETFSAFVKKLMLNEIVPSITENNLSEEDAINFSRKVLDRFRNPFIQHQWLGITMQYSSKMCLRNVPVILNYIKRFDKNPSLMSLGFAAHILFMKPVEVNAGKCFGEMNGNKYFINDDNANLYADAWKENNTANVVKKILINEGLWKTDLTKFNSFTQSIIDDLDLLIKNKNEIHNCIKSKLKK
jgi:tagaturonate reductase